MRVNMIDPTYRFRIYGDPVANQSPRFRVTIGQIPLKILELFTTVIASNQPAADRTRLVIDLLQKKVFKHRGIIFVSTYPVTAVTDWQNEVCRQLQALLNNDWEFPDEPLTGPLIVNVWLYRVRPKSSTSMFPDTKPDYDNLIKPVNDCLQGRVIPGYANEAVQGEVIKDDSRIVETEIKLRWAYYHYPADKYTEEKPGLIIEIGHADNSQQKELNARYKQSLKELKLEYRSIIVGRGKNMKKITILDEMF